jgi:hypothetical protein
LSIHSRGFNNQVRASVLDNPYDKRFYRLELSFSLSAGETTPKALGNLIASVTGEILGAAFHILDMALVTNQFLRQRVPASFANSEGCASSICTQTFTVAPKVQFFWTKGVSPGVYLGDASRAISFFVPTSGGGLYSGIYLLGGVQGSTCTDTDHFDRAIIIHEYAHFLEHVFSRSDSPGGSHNGNSVIDPRLAWSEGFANFIQAAVLGRTNYLDTVRLGCTGPSHQIHINLETMISGQDSDQTSAQGEGNFREISVSRALFDFMTGVNQFNTTDTDGISGNLGFSFLWNAFIALGRSNFPNSSGVIAGRTVSHFNRILSQHLTASHGAPLSGHTFSSVLNHERQRDDLRDYGHLITPGNCTEDLGGNPWIFTQFVPQADTQAHGQAYSNIFTNHRMFLYHYDGTPATSIIRLRYKRQDLTTSPWLTAPNPWDLDLYVYRLNHVFLRNSDILRFSEADFPENTTNTLVWPGYEEVNLSGLSAGYYFINVRVYYPTTSSPRGRNTEFVLENGSGVALCYDSSF